MSPVIEESNLTKDQIEQILKKHAWDLTDEETEKSIASDLGLAHQRVSFSFSDGFSYLTIAMNNGAIVIDTSSEDFAVKEIEF